MASSARLDELKKKFDENPRRYFAPLANELRKSGDLDQAIALCRTHLPLQPGHISGHIVLAQALFETGSLDESREIFHTALGLDPENLIALRYLGDIAKESSDIETARQWYHRVLEVDPRNDEIIQLVRDLDAPPAVPAEPSVEGQAAPPASAAPSSVNHAPPPEPFVAGSDARFAPLSLDELDELDVQGAPDSMPSPNDSAAPAPVDASAPWEGAAEVSDLSLLDQPGIDPFDLDPTGSVDALLEGEQPAAEDFFLTDLVGSNAPTDGGEPHSDVPTAAEAPENVAPHAGAAPQPTEYASEVEATFEEGSFYLEPPPPEPTVTSAEGDGSATAAQSDTPETAADREQVSMPGLDAFAAEYSVPESDLHPSAAPAWPASEAEAAPNAEALARFAQQETAEWQRPAAEPIVPAAQVPDDGLGLEVMEFVPPSREPSAQAPAPAPSADADPIFGRTFDSGVSEQGATPAAFVTETMAELYLQQGFRNEALAVYRELLARNPSDASLRDRIDQIESGSLSSIGMAAAVSENVVESALKRQAARPARSVRSFFASLAGRRAPSPHDARDSSPADSTAPEPESHLDESASEMSYDASAEARVDVSAETSIDADPAPEEPLTPLLSAAETLASFDPFADHLEAAPPAMEPADDAPNAAATSPAQEPVDQLDATDLGEWSAPTVELPVPERAPAAPASETTQPHRSLEELFPETPVTARTEAAAQTFATAFGRSEPQGRPTRAASNELSLDNVFRGAPEGGPPTDGGFSFDQFFSDSRSSGDATAPAATAQDAGRSNGSDDAHDIEQFTAWLEGLKKK